MHHKNPRIENENNTLVAKPMGLIELGLKPIKLSDNLIENELTVAKKYFYRADLNKIRAKSQWRI